MKATYPVLIYENENMHLVRVPDWDIDTEGYSFEDAKSMAKDAISLMAVTYEDEKSEWPAPSNGKDETISESIREITDNVGSSEIQTVYIEIDSDDYRKNVLDAEVKFL